MYKKIVNNIQWHKYPYIEQCVKNYDEKNERLCVAAFWLCTMWVESHFLRFSYAHCTIFLFIQLFFYCSACSGFCSGLRFALSVCMMIVGLLTNSVFCLVAAQNSTGSSDTDFSSLARIRCGGENNKRKNKKNTRGDFNWNFEGNFLEIWQSLDKKNWQKHWKFLIDEKNQSNYK